MTSHAYPLYLWAWPWVLFRQLNYALAFFTIWYSRFGTWTQRKWTYFFKWKLCMTERNFFANFYTISFEIERKHCFNKWWFYCREGFRIVIKIIVLNVLFFFNLLFSNLARSPSWGLIMLLVVPHLQEVFTIDVYSLIS